MSSGPGRVGCSAILLPHVSATNDLVVLRRHDAPIQHRFRAARATLGRALATSVAALTELSRAGRRSEATVDFHRRKAGHLVRIFEQGGTAPYPLKTLTPREVDAYISQRRAEGGREHDQQGARGPSEGSEVSEAQRRVGGRRQRRAAGRLLASGTAHGNGSSPQRR